MGIIVTIGGGDIARKGTLAIDKEIIRLANKKNPRVLFIPTASYDSNTECKNMQIYFGSFLGCRVRNLLLLNEKYSQKEIENLISSSDIIYVGGGNTKMMLDVWRKNNVDQLLIKAYKNNNVILTGISAGCICWYEYGHSDSLSYENPKKWKYIKIKGLGLLQGFCCPHYNSKTRGVSRRKDFQNMLKNNKNTPNIAIDDNAALVFVNGKIKKSISSKSYSKSRYINFSKNKFKFQSI